VADINQQLLGLAKPVSLVAKHRSEFHVTRDGINLLRQLIEELSDFSEPGVDLVGRLALRAEGVESSLHCYLPG
jgi:hypothetical protein